MLPFRVESSRYSVTDERPQVRQGLLRARELGVELAALALPHRTQVVVLLETRHIRLAVESHRDGERVEAVVGKAPV